MRLIYADDVKKRGDCYPPDVRSIISNILRHTKTVKDVVPVKHGHWIGRTAIHWTKKHGDNGDKIYKEHTYYQCSECRRRTVIKSAYCPACGCHMKEEE